MSITIAWRDLLLGGITSWLLLLVGIPWLRRDLLDQPNARSSHQRPTPRGGGIAFVLVGSLLAPFSGTGWISWIPPLCLPLAVVGMVDDRHDLPALWRYGAQLITGAALLVMTTLSLPWWLLPLALIAITAVINFVNFTDGLDGLVAGCCCVVLLVAVLEMPDGSGSALCPLIGALLGFLAWNWSPAKVFMGDVGSTYLGAVVAGVVMQQPTPSAALGLLLVALPLLGDALFTVLRRLSAGQDVFEAHRSHLYQRLHQAGWPHGRVALLYIGATVLLGLALLLRGLPLVLPIAALELLLGLWLDRHTAVRFERGSRSKFSSLRRSKEVDT